MAGRYDDRQAFIERLRPLIDRQLEIYRDDPRGYVQFLPLLMHGYFIDRPPSRKMSLAFLLADCLIATHRRPTAEYIWKLMHDPETASDGSLWDPRQDPDLTDLM